MSRGRPLVSLVVATMLSGCGGSVTSPAAPGPGASDGDAVDVERLAADLATGLEEGGTAQLTLTLDFGLQTMVLGAAVDYSSGSAEMSGTLRQRRWNERQGRWTQRELDTRIVDGVLYLQVRGDRFRGYDLAEGTLPRELDEVIELLDPLGDFHDLGGALLSAERTGEQEIAGDRLERFELLLDPDELKVLQADGVETADQVTYVVWVDEDDRVRELITDLGSEYVDVNLRLVAWGTPVTIEAPEQVRMVEIPTDSA